MYLEVGGLGRAWPRWLGCVSLRTAASALRQGAAEEEPSRSAVAAFGVGEVLLPEPSFNPTATEF